MTTADGRTEEQVRRAIELEREQLAGALASLRSELKVVSRVRLPTIAAGALAAGFVLAGGIGATMRLFARRGRETN